MTRGTKLTFTIFLGLLTLLPLVYMVGYTTYVLPRLMTSGGAEPAQRNEFFSDFNVAFMSHIVAVMYTLILLVCYLITLHKSPHVESNAKRKWGWILVVGNVIAMPVFWFRFILLPNLRQIQP